MPVNTRHAREREIAATQGEPVTLPVRLPGSQQRTAPSGAHDGAVIGGVRTLLRLEGLAAFGAASAVYAHAGFPWPIFALLVLAPDLSMLAYLVGSRAGAIAYDLAHTYAIAVPLALAGCIGGLPAVAVGGLIWTAHIGFDRALGFGLKYQAGFAFTHLGRLGRS